MTDRNKSTVISNNPEHLQKRGGHGDTPMPNAVQFGAMEGVVPPTDLDEVRRYRLRQLKNWMKKCDFPALLLFDPLNTRYATDVTNQSNRSMRIEHRCVFVPLEGDDNASILDVADTPFLADGSPNTQNGEYMIMEKYHYEATGNGAKSEENAAKFAQQIKYLRDKYVGDNEWVIAVDRISNWGASALRSLGFQLEDGQKVTENARSIKSDGELILMQAVIDSCEVGIRKMNDATNNMRGRDTMSENELWSILQAHNIADGSEWIETRLLAAGQRTNPWFQECSGNVFRVGDMISFDTDLVGPYGYCADMSRAWVCGNQNITNDQRKIYNAAVLQVENNIKNLSRYKSYKELSKHSWTFHDQPGWYMNRYSCPYHGIGLCDEYPSIPWGGEDWDTYGYSGEVQEKMALSVESYIGDLDLSQSPPIPGPDGVKLEEMVYMDTSKPEGFVRMTSYPWDPYLLDGGLLDQ